MAGGQRDIYGLVRASEAEHREFDPALDAKRTTEIPSNMQMRVDYQGGNDAVYVGFAEKGMGISASGWLLQKYTYDSGKATLRQISYDAWDDRELTTYE